MIALDRHSVCDGHEDVVPSCVYEINYSVITYQWKIDDYARHSI